MFVQSGFLDLALK